MKEPGKAGKAIYLWCKCDSSEEKEWEVWMEASNTAAQFKEVLTKLLGSAWTKERIPHLPEKGLP